MNMPEKTEQMKKYILANKIFIAVQIILVALSVILNFIFDDTTVFMTIFIHIGIFVIYNCIVESIVEYCYLRKKYARICDETHYLRYFKLKKRMYKVAKNNQDATTSTLISQTVIKNYILALSLILLLFMVSFE